MSSSRNPDISHIAFASALGIGLPSAGPYAAGSSSQATSAARAYYPPRHPVRAYPKAKFICGPLVPYEAPKCDPAQSAVTKTLPIYNSAGSTTEPVPAGSLGGRFQANTPKAPGTYKTPLPLFNSAVSAHSEVKSSDSPSPARESKDPIVPHQTVESMQKKQTESESDSSPDTQQRRGFGGAKS